MHINIVARSTRFVALLCLLALLLTACDRSMFVPVTPETPTPRPAEPASAAVSAPTATPASIATANIEWPTTGWNTSTPEAQGMDAQKLAEMLKAIKDENLNLHSLLIFRHGYLVSENYFGSYDANTRHQLYSVTKSFIATLIGIALDKGYIKDTDQRVVDFFPQRTFANPSERKTSMTLDDLLTMRTGLDWTEGDPAYRDLSMSPDWLKFMLDKPLVAEPGRVFNYCSGCSHVLSVIVQETTGSNPRDFADQFLFKPLGITDYRWDVNRAGMPIGGWGLQLTPRDMAKLGYLYLHHGQWDGQQIVSAKWVENATRLHTTTDGPLGLGYGYQWWTYPSLKAYTALGLAGQTVFVIPELDLIVVTTAELDGHDQIFRLIEQYILPAVQDAQ
jgi:CubicO group peptidase (beta-lactamase class C family)